MKNISEQLRYQLVVCCCLLLLGWASGEKLSAEQKAPQFASGSAGQSLALPRNATDDGGGGEQSRLSQILAGLHLRASGQTPADTSLLLPAASSRRALRNKQNPLELLRIKASGQTPADTSLLVLPQSRRRSGQGPAHVTLLDTPGKGPTDAAARQTPANVGLLAQQPANNNNNNRPTAAQQDEDAQRQEVTSFKQVNGQSVRVVSGNYGYQSPEGLPVSFKYMSDENGNQASFSIGTPTAGGASASRPANAGAAAAKNGAAGAKAAAAGNKAGATAAAGDGDRKYLPPK